MTDIALRGGLVLDGTGAAGFVGEVGIEGDRVVALGPPGTVPAARDEIDATGQVIAPGFVDLHSHSDFTLLVDPRAVSAISQGVTTEVVGNCGFGCFPLLDHRLAPYAIYGFDDAVPLDWTTADGYFSRLEERQPAVNVASLVPNGQLRLGVVGLADRPADTGERRRMAYLLDEALEQGGWGYSTGLEYAAERGADEDELADLCTVCAHRQRLYATHTRRRDAGSVEAVAEALRTATRSGARLQVSHLVPRSGSAATEQCLAAVEHARAAGLDVAFDMHTRLFGTTTLLAGLPPRLLEQPTRLAETLRSRSARDTVAAAETILSADWSRVELLANDVWPQAAFQSIADLAHARGQRPADTVCDLLVEADDPSSVMVIIRCYTEEQQRAAFGHPLCVPGSDATTLAPSGPLAGHTFHGAYTWAAWYLRFCRDDRLLPLAEAVHRLTGAPAARIGLPDRGVLRVGAAADVVVFDPSAVTERGTLAQPNVVATGFATVLVNGVPALRDGVLLPARAGRVLRAS